ncbi:MAG: UDP-N-acetylenolpyruvoylglucosamine reductase [Candidatus Kapaibacterium sp.]|nr:MAG: UDP-N-acetylenolpyruvoylglucosamine reductase [Candidatus Kapabacteria bacterium]
MRFQQNVDLGPLTTFRTRGAVAQQFYWIESERDAREFATAVVPSASDWLLLGGGSNVLPTRTIEVAACMQLPGRRVVEEGPDAVTVRLGAGERWHACVQWAVSQGWAGIEAMALIPGTVGAAPIQNIGAYGQQLSDVCQWVEGIEIPSGELRTLPADECRFGYRDSIFKHELASTFIITAVAIRLVKRQEATVAYPELARALDGIARPTISDVFECVVRLRQRKLPPPDVGSAGSFFKNPIVPVQVAASLAERYPSMPQFPFNGAIKLSAGWLIEQCGFKGVRRGDVGVYDRHALVLVNWGAAQGTDVVRLAAEIKDAVRARFGIELEEEVIIV